MQQHRDFLWGVATSAFQLEGSPYCDWASWDDILSTYPAVTNHYHLYRDDLLLLNELGVNAYRLSFEWSRIEPREHHWDDKEVSRYQEIIDILNSNQITPMLTIHHFTHPLWFIKKYPWHEPASVDKFLHYAQRLIASIRGVNYWITFNEPYVLILAGYFEGCSPPGLRDIKLGIKALNNILICHSALYDMLHSQSPHCLVSIAHNMAAIAPWHRFSPIDRLLAKTAKYFYNHSLLDAFATGKLKIDIPLLQKAELNVPIENKLDFVGVNYYMRVHLRFNPLKKMMIELRHRDITGDGLTDMGWEIHPEGLAKVIRYASKLHKPIIITENGIATRDAIKKVSFMKRHLDVLEDCIKQGYDVRGYFYWSLIDNYEWLQGLDARFGLYKVDFATMKRIPTPAAKYYAYAIEQKNAVFRSLLNSKPKIYLA